MEGLTKRPAVRAGGWLALAIALALGAMEAAQRLIGSKGPSFGVLVAMTVAIFAMTLLAERVKRRNRLQSEANERGTRLASSLRGWPVATPEDSDREALGLFPGAVGPADDYVPRSADERLRQAIDEHSLLIVAGPRGAGKTRSAIEAVKATLPGALVFAPRDARALRELLELDPGLCSQGDPGTQRILWLDGLQRYMRAIDVTSLERLMTPAAGPEGEKAQPPVTIVATARDTSWRRALRSDEADGVAAKTLLSRAKVVELPLVLDEDELKAARDMHGDRDFAEGLGRALQSTGEGARREQAADPRREQAQPSLGAPGRVREDLLFLFGAFVVLSALGLIGGFAASGDFLEKPPASIAEQVDRARSEGGAGTRDVIASEKVDLHGSGEASYFFAFGDGEKTKSGSERADEIVVLDRHPGNDLDLAFRFEPSELADFQFRFIGDVDGDGVNELVGGYGTKRLPGELLVPFALDWDGDSGGYRMVPLVTAPPDLSSEASGPDVEEFRRLYEDRLTLFDTRNDRLFLSGYRVQDFTVDPKPKRLVAAFLSNISPNGARTIELVPSAFSQVGGRPLTRHCNLSGDPPETVRVPSSAAQQLHLVALKRWLEMSKGRFCAVWY